MTAILVAYLFLAGNPVPQAYVIADDLAPRECRMMAAAMGRAADPVTTDNAGRLVSLKGARFDCEIEA